MMKKRMKHVKKLIGVFFVVINDVLLLLLILDCQHAENANYV